MSNDVSELERELFVRSFMPNLRGSAAVRMASMLEPRTLPADTYLFRAGEAPDQFFFIVDGRVSMELAGHQPWIFGARSLVGMLDVNLGRPRRRGCRTLTATRVLAGPSKSWLDLFEDDPFLAENAIQTLSHQLHELWKENGHLLPVHSPVSVPPLPRPLPLSEKVLVLRDTPLFQLAGIQAIASLAQVAEEMELAPGMQLFAAGEAHRMLHVVAEGQIELCGERSWRFGPQTLLGAAAALSGELVAYSARALDRSLVLRIRAEDYYDQAEEQPQLTRAALAYLAIEREQLMEICPPQS
jgi:CRP-like cAMP-binding protein